MAILGNLALFFVNNSQKSLTQALHEGLRQRPSPFKLIVFSYGVWLCASALTSIMPGYSWLGHPYTQFGVITTLGCLSLSYLYSKSADVYPTILILSLCTFFMAIFTLLEAIGYRPLIHIVQSPNMLYPAAFVGHRPHLGGWFSIIVLMPIFFYRHRRIDAWFWVWTLSGIVGLALCTTTSATLGVGIGIIFWLFHTCILHRERLKTTLLATAFFAFSIALLPNLTQSAGTALGLNPPHLKEYGSTGSMKPRLYMWKSAWNAATDRPLTGWGTDTFGYQVFEHLTKEDAEALFRAELGFSKDYAVEHKGMTYYAYKNHGLDKDQQTGSLLYVRPHNLILDELYSNGFIGLSLWLLTIISLLVKVNKSTSPLSFIYFIVACLPYLIYLQAWFYVTSVTPLFFILLGIMLKDIKNSQSKL